MNLNYRHILGLVLVILLAAGCTSAGFGDEGGSIPLATPSVEDELAGATDSSALLDEAGDPIALATYQVDGDLIEGDSIDPEHLAVWERFTEVIPLELRPEVERFEPIDGNSGTDGTMFASDDPNVWVVQLDVMGSVPQSELERTMIHEFAHLLTLRPSQVPPMEAGGDVDYDALYEETKASCGIAFQSEGCPLADSYLSVFANQFWSDLLPDDVEELDSSDEAGEVRFEDYPGRFVTAYAGTQPTEDIAESFAEYVLADTLPTGDSDAEAKLRFFDNYPEVRQIRDLIREASPAGQE